jgi:DNA helicase HerA-like ATPase
MKELGKITQIVIKDGKHYLKYDNGSIFSQPIPNSKLDYALSKVGYYHYIADNGKWEFIQKPIGATADNAIGRVLFSSTSYFNMSINRRYTDSVEEFDFVKVNQLDGTFYGQITEHTSRPKTVTGSNGGLMRVSQASGKVDILGTAPRRSIESGSNVFLAEPKEISGIMGFSPDGYYLGKMYPTEIDVRLPCFRGESDSFSKGCAIYGGIQNGKTHLLRVLAEEKAKKGYAVLIPDLLGDLSFKLPNTVKYIDDGRKAEQLEQKFKRFNVTKRAVDDSLFITFNNDADSIADILLEKQGDLLVEEEEGQKRQPNLLDKPEFYKSILKAGRITTLSLNTLSNKEVAIAIRSIANALKLAGAEGVLPPTAIIFDESQRFAKEGMGKELGKVDFIDLVKESGHFTFNLIISTQRKSSVSKDAIAPLSNMVVFGLQDKSDTDRLPKSFAHYADLLTKLPTGRAVCKGFTKGMMVMDVRPSETLHLREARIKRQAYDENPEKCVLNKEWAERINKIRFLR